MSSKQRRGSRLAAVSALALSIVLAATACSGSNPDAGADKELRKVNFGYGVNVIGVDASPVTSAPLGLGFWEDEGLDVEIQPIDGAVTAFQLLAQGKLDVTSGGSAGGMVLKNQDVPIVSIFNRYVANSFYPAVLESSDITTVEDFKGKNIGLVSLSGSFPLWFDLLLEEHGMTRDDMGDVVAIGTGAQAVTALESGQVDVYYGYLGAYLNIMASTDIKFRTFEDDPLFTNSSFGVSLWVREEMVKNEPEVVAAIVKGAAEGAFAARNFPEMVVENHYEMYPQTRPAGDKQAGLDLGVKVLNGALDAYTQDPFGFVSDENVTYTATKLQEAGQIDKVLPVEEYYDDQFIEAANEFDEAKIMSDLEARKD